MLMVRRSFHGTARVRKFLDQFETLRSLRNKLVTKEDAKKRPSSLEIRAKQLPGNTPTLGERIIRDRAHLFHNYDRKSGYYEGKTGSFRDHLDDVTMRDVFESAFEIKDELFKLKSEYLEAFRKASAPPEPGERDLVWNSEPEDAVDRWVATCDSDWGEGYTTASFIRSRSGKMLFFGELSTRVPLDGRTERAGYANLSSKVMRRSFYRIQYFNWFLYTHLIMRVRGDGRTYMLNIHPRHEFDIAWNDLHNYPLHTRGGPYWQTIKIPFSKFFLSHRGVIQDNQDWIVPVLDKSHKFSISIKDRIDGPFSLEIDYIGVKYDPDDVEEKSAYEMYQMPEPNYLRP